MRTAVVPTVHAVLRKEFDHQVDTLVRLGYPELVGVRADVFAKELTPLAEMLAELPRHNNEHHLPFVIVVGEGLVRRDEAVGLTEMGGRRGFTSMETDDLKRFTPVPDLGLPAGAYLLVDVDTGPDTLDVVPDDALPTITSAGRSPLTIDEGLALVTHVPGILRARNCFSMLGSRCGDRRVPALWVSDGKPRLGWCWAGAPHSWLGSASCGDRIAKQAAPQPRRAV